MLVDDEDSEEDSDFGTDQGGSGSDDDDESGEDEQEGSDEDMIDEGVDKEELKHLQKGVEIIDKKRRRRGDK